MRVAEANMKTLRLLARFSAIQTKNAIKNIAHIAVVGMILFSPTFLMSFAAGQTSTSSTEFTPAEVFRLDWGPGEKQVGLLQVYGGNYGPQSFVVDEAQHQIYILDSTNSRIMIFDMSGSLLSAVSISDTADDLALAPGGDMLVLYRTSKKVVRYYPNGLLQSVYPIPDRKSPITGIQFSPEFGTVVETADQQSSVLTTEEAVPAEGSQFAEPSTAKSMGLERGGSSFYLERTASGDGTLHILDPRGNTQRALHLKSKEQRIVALTLIGVDRDGNTYLTVEESGESAPVRRYIRELDSQGRLLAEALIPYSAYVFTSRDLRVTDDGRVYQLLPLKETVEVLEWKIASPKERATPEFVNRLFSNSIVHTGEFIPGDIAESTTIESPLLFQPQATISSDAVLSRAESYKNHLFNVSSMNIAAGGGVKCGGKIVQTYITSPGAYTGVPYKWGGFSGLTNVTSVMDSATGMNFDEGLVAGKYAGDKNTNTSSGSSCAVGVDCSGFVSQIWGLTSKQSTSTLPGVSCCLNSSCTGSSAPYYPSYIMPGDILNSATSSGGVGHVRLVQTQNDNGSFSVYESSARTWNVATWAYTASQLSSNYYYPFRGREVLNSLQVGDTIQTSSDVNVRSCAGASCALICTAPAGSTGALSAVQDSDGYLWWQVMWSNVCASGTRGWSVGCYLQPYSGSFQLPTVTSFEISPKTVTLGSQLTASIAGTQGTNPLSFVSLMRTSDLTVWTTVAQIPVSDYSVNVTLYDTPTSAGTYLYSAHITDNTGQFGTAAAVQITVSPAKTTPTVKVLPSSNTITTSQPVSVTVTVTGAKGNPAPTGTVTLVGGSFSGSGTLNNGSTVINIPAATFSTAGNYQLTAAYQGDSNYNGATGTNSIMVKRSRL
jgi:hypothetical protein